MTESIGDITTARNNQMSDLGQQLAGAMAPEPAQEEETQPSLGEQALEDDVEESQEAAETVPDDDEYVDLPDEIEAKEFAEIAGVDPSYFYDNVKYSFADGKRMSIGEMKDAIQSGGAADMQQLMQERQQFEAQKALEVEHGQKIQYAKYMLDDLKRQYQSVDWQKAIAEHGEKAEVEKLKLQNQYTQIEGKLSEMQAEYEHALGEYQSGISQREIEQIVKTHPEWQDPAKAVSDLKALHNNIAGTGISYDEMIMEVNGAGGAKKLAILELAAKGAAAGDITNKRVRRKVRNLKGGRTISAAQQRKMQLNKKLKDVKSMTVAEKKAVGQTLAEQLMK